MIAWRERLLRRTAAVPGPQPAPEVAPAPSAHPSGAPGLRLDVTQRAAEADRLLQHPVLQQAFSDIRAEAQMMWCATKMTEHEKREELYRVIQTLEMVRAKLLTYRAAGRIKAERDAA